MTHFAVTAVGADRPGIVAAVTGAFAEHGCNLEDSSMTILRGQFAMMLVVDAPAGVGAAELEAALAGPAAELDLVVTVRPAPQPPESRRRCRVVDRLGLRRRPSRHRARGGVAAGREGVNIVDLSTRMVGTTDQPAYAMVLEVTLPPDGDPHDLERDLAAKAGELGVTCRLHPSEADIL